MNNNEIIDNNQYMVSYSKSGNKLKQKLIKHGYIDEIGKEHPVAILIDNDHKWFYPVPGIFMYWKYSLNRKQPLRHLTIEDILNNFQKLIVEMDKALYNELLRR